MFHQVVATIVALVVDTIFVVGVVFVHPHVLVHVVVCVSATSIVAFVALTFDQTIVVVVLVLVSTISFLVEMNAHHFDSWSRSRRREPQSSATDRSVVSAMV